MRRPSVTQRVKEGVIYATETTLPYHILLPYSHCNISKLVQKQGGQFAWRNQKK